MAVLDEPNRREVWAEFMQQTRQQFGALEKADLRAAIDAIDDWLDSTPIPFNNQLPQPAKSELTRRQKFRLLKHVVDRRLREGS